MRHEHLIKHLRPKDVIQVLTCLLFFLLFMTSPFIPLFAQDATPSIKIETVDEMLERIRFLYQMKQYSQVLIECKKLEQRDPTNKMASYYKSRAERKMEEMGITRTPPGQRTPMASPSSPSLQATPLGTLPPFPEKTPVSAFPTSPALAQPSQTPGPLTTSPFMEPMATATQAPVPEKTSEIQMPGLTPAPEKTYAPAGTPPPARTPAPLSQPSPPPVDYKRSGRIKELMSYAIMALIAVAVIVVIVLGFLFYRKIVRKKQLARLQKAYEEKGESQIQEAISPAAFPDVTELEPVAPIFPDAFAPGAAPEEPPVVISPEMPSPDAPDRVFAPEEPADIPSPSSLGALKTEVIPEPALPDIPSPSESPIPKEERMAKPPGAFDNFPPDLPTLQEAEEPAAPQMPQGPEELELPRMILQEEEEKPVSEPPSFAEPAKEEPPAFDLAKPEEEAQPIPSAPVEELPAFEQPALEKPGQEMEIEAFPASQIFPEEEAEHSPSISIEEALGMDFSLEKSPEKDKTSLVELPPAPPEKDVYATTMELNSFLFDSDSEEKAETILDVPGRSERKSAVMTQEPESGEKEEEGTSKAADVFESLIFDEASLAETKIKTPEPPPEISPAAVSSPESPALPSAAKPFVPLEQELKEPIITTTPRMERLSPFEKAELKDQGIVLPSKPPSGKEEEPAIVSPDSFQGGESGFKAKEEAPGQKIEDRNENLFKDQFKRGREAYEARDWKKAVHYLTVAAAIKPDHKILKDMLVISRQEKRKTETNP